MKCSEIIGLLNQVIPEGMACEWDHVGLWLGRPDRSVSKILLALELNETVADYAIEIQADMIITHHPFIFKAIDRITSQNAQGRIIMKLIRNDIDCYAAHTNYDAAPGGMADQFARRLKMLPVQPLIDEQDYVMPDGIAHRVGCGRLCEVNQGICLSDLCASIKANFGMKSLEVYCGKKEEDPVFYKVAILPGSGRSALKKLRELQADVLISADITYHDALDAATDGITIINAGHYGMEHIFTEDMETILGRLLSPEIEIVKMPVSFPYMAL